ncbi:cytochrome b-c1 complex subunit 9 [Morchella snyderi]|nr:cytochrome b-c1 complex subunit 9 [Morchella snyderi]
MLRRGPLISSAIYNAIFRRNYVFVGSVFAGAFAFEILFDQATDKLWDNLNRGRQWKDIRHRYVEEE